MKFKIAKLIAVTAKIPHLLPQTRDISAGKSAGRETEIEWEDGLITVTMREQFGSGPNGVRTKNPPPRVVQFPHEGFSWIPASAVAVEVKPEDKKLAKQEARAA